MVDGDDGGADADSEATDDTTNAEKSYTVGSGLKDSTNAPDDGGNLDGSATGQSIGKEGRAESTEEGTSRHRSGLVGVSGLTMRPCIEHSQYHPGEYCRRISTAPTGIPESSDLPRRLTEVILISRSSENTGHGRDIKTEESTANGSEATNGVDVVEGLHPAIQSNSLGGERQLVMMRSFKLGSSKVL